MIGSGDVLHWVVERPGQSTQKKPKLLKGPQFLAMDETSDEDLMLKVAEGDEQAFPEIVKRHSHLVYGTVVKMLGPRASQEAEDVAQEIFVRVYRSAHRYKPQAKFTTWLLTITRNCVFTACAKRKKRRGFFCFTDASPADEEAPVVEFADPSAPHAGDQVLQGELEEHVTRAIARLPEQQRMSLILRHYEQLDYEEIAKILKVTLPSVKSLLFRARQTLRQDLAEYLKE